MHIANLKKPSLSAPAKNKAAKYLLQLLTKTGFPVFI